MSCVKNLAARFAAEHATGIADFALGARETGLNGQLRGINIRPHQALTMRPPVPEIISRNADLVAQTEGAGHVMLRCSVDEPQGSRRPRLLRSRPCQSLGNPGDHSASCGHSSSCSMRLGAIAWSREMRKPYRSASWVALRFIWQECPRQQDRCRQPGPELRWRSE
jgi:hypothetical protein